MAKLFPDINTIERLHQKPTEGELVLLDFLDKNLTKDFEVYFQPFINGDRPDIVILKKNGGVIIIEVKDWFLDNYFIDENTDWYLKKDNVKIKSPLSQVKSYKDNLYNLHINGLLHRCIQNREFNIIVNTLVYFHNVQENEINNFLLRKFNNEKYEGYRTFVKYNECWGRNSLNESQLFNYIKKIGLNKTSRLFDENLYYHFKRYLQPPLHMIEEGKNIIYTKEQKELIVSEPKARKKIKGLAGCGKTFVLAKRSVDAYKRTESTILILTFNLSLKNYIHDKISDIREEFPWRNFYITNYHQFFKQKLTIMD